MIEPASLPGFRAESRLILVEADPGGGHRPASKSSISRTGFRTVSLVPHRPRNDPYGVGQIIGIDTSTIAAAEHAPRA